MAMKGYILMLEILILNFNFSSISWRTSKKSYRVSKVLFLLQCILIIAHLAQLGHLVILLL